MSPRATDSAGTRDRDRGRVVPAAAAAAIATGGIAAIAGAPEVADALWAVAVGALLVVLAFEVVGKLAAGRVGVDAIALVAMAAALALGQYLAGAVIALMLSGGNALEARAARRARREVGALLERAPKVAHRRRAGAIEEIPVDALEVGDIVAVRSGEILPVDGAVLSAEAVLDESTLTGEALPVRYRRGALVRSGTANAGAAFDLRTGRRASESAYAALVRLVRDAEAERAPFVRLADRYAAVLLPLTLVLAGAAWALSGDPVRAVAVLVVATPCPLILAAPIAFTGGVSRAARRGIIVKGTTAIEQIGRARTVVLDKTGTLTSGTPDIERIETIDGVGAEDALRLAAAVDQLSAHVLAEAIVAAAQRRHLPLAAPATVEERAGEGVAGRVEGHDVVVGSAGWLRERGVATHGDQAAPSPAGMRAGRARILVAVDGRLAATIVMADRVRDDAPAVVAGLRALGVRSVAMLSGDDRRVAEAVGAQAGLDEVFAERTPDEKVAALRMLRARPGARPIVMVGDGINDAPALAAADVGVALAGAGTTVAAETADVVITVDRLERVLEAAQIGQRSLRIARQSVIGGMALSFVAMAFAALGHIAPVAGALLQEGIDVAVIVNALRAVRP
jgi:heavy metal translocating P-type ATPase